MFNHDLPEDVKELVEKLQLQKAHLINQEIWAHCPYHSDRVPDNFSINVNTGLFYCFSCHASGSVLSLGFDKGLNYNKALVLWNRVRKSSGNEIKIPSKPVDKFVLDQYIKNGHPTSALERIEWDVDILKKYHVYCDGEDNVVYFIPDERRRIRSVVVKYNRADIPIINNYWKDEGYFIGNDIDDTDYIILVEGLWDALWVNKHTNYKCIASGGTSITPNQVNYLKTIRNLVIMMDGDQAGRYTREYLHQNLANSRFESYYAGRYQCDPDQLSQEKLFSIIKNSMSWSEYELFKNKK